MDESRLRWGVIGCGSVVKTKSGPSIMGTGRSEIIAVMRRSREMAEAYARENNILIFTDQAAAVIENPRVDIVYVATPPSSHREYTLAAAAAGKHVLVEKPMGLSQADSHEMIRACERAGVELFVAYYRRFQPHVMVMKSLIEEGALGRIGLGFVHYASGGSGDGDRSWRSDPKISGGGPFVDILSHRIDLLVDILGDIEDVSGTAVPSDLPEIEKAASLSIRFASGALGSVTGDFDFDRGFDRFELIGSRGEIATNNLDGHSFVFRSGGREEVFAFEPFPAPHLGLIRHIEDALAGRDRNRVSGASGAITDMALDRGLRRRIDY